MLPVIKWTMSTFFSPIINLEGLLNLNWFIGSKVTAILVNGGIFLLVEWHREGSAPVACAAGLFTYRFNIILFVNIELFYKHCYDIKEGDVLVVVKL